MKGWTLKLKLRYEVEWMMLLRQLLSRVPGHSGRKVTNSLRGK